MSYNNRDDYDGRMNPRVSRQEPRYAVDVERDGGRRGGDGGRVGYDDGYYHVQETPRQHQQPYRNNPVENGGRREATRGRSVGGGHLGAEHQEPRDYHSHERRRRTSESSIPQNRDDFQIGRRPLGRNEELPTDPVQNDYENRTARGHEHRHSAERRAPPPVVSDYDYPPTLTPREGIPPMNDRNRDRLQPPNQRSGNRQDYYNNDGNQDYYVSPPSNNPQLNRERFPSPQRDEPYRIAPQREPVLDNRRNEQLGDEPYYDNLPLQNERILHRRVDRDLNDYPAEEQPLRYQHQRRRESPDREFANQRDYGREDRRGPGLQRDFVDRPSQQQHERDLSHLDPRRDTEPPLYREQQNYEREDRRHPGSQHDFGDRPSQKQHERDLSHLDPRHDHEPPLYHEQQNYGKEDRRGPGLQRDFVHHPSQQQHERDLSNHDPRRDIEPPLYREQQNYEREDRRHPGPQRDFVHHPNQQQRERDLSNLDTEPPLHREQQNYERDYRRTDLYYPRRNHLEDDMQRQPLHNYRGVDQQQAEEPIHGGRQQAERIYEEPPHHFRREEHEQYQHRLRQPSPQQHPGCQYDDHFYDETPLQNREQPRHIPYVPPVYEQPLRQPL
uniref:Uncharacterized protein n=1 Tax=Panagrolaimus sp. PS1159 TaxID=55785 RepID=A0AC35F1L5_9BILA